MADVTFITGNQHKVDFMGKHLGRHINHQKLELEEIQSMDLKEISEHKARQAYGVVKKPVLVEDVGLFCDGLGGLPGPLVKWFLQTIDVAGICLMANRSGDNSAVAAICFTYFDGTQVKFFEGQVRGSIGGKPRGENGYGWDAAFIPEGSDRTYAEMDDEEIKDFGLRTTTVFPQIKEFLGGLDKIN